MKKNYSIIFILIFFSITLFSQEKKQMSVFIHTGNLIFEKKKVYLSVLKDIMIEKITQNTSNIQIIDNSKITSQSSLKEINNLVFSRGLSGFFYIDAKENNKKITVITSLYSSGGDLIEQIESNLSLEFNEETKKNWIKIIEKMIVKTNLLKTKTKTNANFSKIYKFDHDFPIISIGVNGISGKFYFDRKDDNKLFSLFPIDVNLSIFPLKYFEVGTFINFDKDNMIYRYLENNTSKLYYSNFIIKYGFNFGLSFFSPKTHFSFGLRFYNLFYSLTNSNWEKTNDYKSFFLPQFSIYLKLDFPIMKILYFTVFINFKTVPKFYLDSNLFYSKPFDYDFFVLEFSFIGLSIII